MKSFIQFSETAKKVHPLAVHVKSLGDNQYKVHAVGSKVNVDHVKPGDILRSSDLDDLSDAGHKVKELNEEVDLEEGMPAGVVNDKQRLGQMTDKELADLFKDTPDDRLRARARTHAIKDLDHYIKRREKGLKEEYEFNIKYAHDKEDDSGRTTIGVHKVKASDKKAAQELTKKHLKNAGKKNISVVDEEVEQVDELKRQTVVNYHDKSWSQRRQLKTKHSSIYGTDPEKQKIIDKRERGLALAHKNMFQKKADFMDQKNEEVEQIGESGLSTNTLANYSIKASAATTDKELSAKKTSNRYAGVHKVDKILSVRDKK